MAKKYQYHYYRIYDDREQFNYIKSSFEEKRIRSMLKKFEKKHQQYYNAEFVTFLKEFDQRAELIEVINITY